MDELARLSDADRERLLKVVGAWVRHAGDDEWGAVDDVLRPLSDDSEVRGRLLSAARREYVASLSDAELDAWGAEISRQRSELLALARRESEAAAIERWDKDLKKRVERPQAAPPGSARRGPRLVCSDE